MDTILNLHRPDVRSLTVEEIVKNYPPLNWEHVFQKAEPEIELVSRILKHLGRFYPENENLFAAFDKCPFPPNVVILGQDPYHTDDNGRPQANGMAFSTDRGHPIQPSLGNIYTELEREYDIKNTIDLIKFWEEEQKKLSEQFEKIREIYPEQYQEYLKTVYPQEALVKMATQISPIFQKPHHGDLTSWANQRVLLLNSCLTVKPHEPGSHKSIWNGVVTKVLEEIQEANPECIFLLMGKKAETLSSKLGQRAIKIYTSHPSPFSAYKGSRDVPAFMGSGCFKQINAYLVKQGKAPINWSLN